MPENTPANMAHLLRRAGFGADRATIDAAVRAGIEATVDRLLAAPCTTPADPPPPQPLTPDVSTLPGPAASADGGMEARRRLMQEAKGELAGLQAWWVTNMATTPAPLVEKMTLVWHGWFATGIAKVKLPLAMFNQNVTLRTHALGPFPDLVKAVSRDPAMVFWLNLQQNEAGSVNENYARELMELFTLGVGNYSQADVENVARAFTGGRLMLRYRYVSVPRLHDSGRKTILGRTGDFDGDAAADVITSRDESAAWVVRRLWSNLAGSEPDAALLKTLADAYVSGGRRIGTLLRVILNSDAFYSDAAKAGLVKTPVEFLAGALRAFGIRLQTSGGQPPKVATALTLMGQEPFNPPSVGGWPQNRYWTSTAMTRTRFVVAGSVAGYVPYAALPRPGDRVSVDALVDRLGLVDPAAGLMDALYSYRGDPHGLVQLALASPQYQMN